MIQYGTDANQYAKFLAGAELQVPYASALALNRTAAAVSAAIKQKINQVFDRPTPYTQRALRVRRATKQKLSARVDFKDAAGKGIPADKYLGPQVHGGGRSQKRFERALQRVGGGSFYAPGAGADLDAYGNMSRGQLVRLMSYLQAFGEQGYRANATERSRARTAKVGTSPSGYRRINGVMYFVSKGKGTMSGNREQMLPAGIWRKTGTHGADVKPVLLSIDAPTYTPRLPFYETADEVYGKTFDQEFTRALGDALATAR